MEYKYKLETIDTQSGDRWTRAESNDLDLILTLAEAAEDEDIDVDAYEHFDYVINGKPVHTWY